ncbi:MAG: MotA/TolQ/ExbB proton channel family protein [Verrucomicrobiota bacterium]|nr:MotA/TolQ/ExbB proton channel family protein [Verrucomicrobiota bacterium]
MKKTLIVSLCSVTLALTAFAQDPAASPGASPADATSTDLNAAPAVSPAADATAPVDPAATGTTTTDPAMSPAGIDASPAMAATPAGPAVASPAVASPAAAAAASPNAAAPTTAESPTSKNFLIDNFRAGGPIMWPILIVSIIGLMVVIERCFWWGARFFRRDPKRVEKVFTAIETGDINEASKLARGSRDPVLRMLWNGLNHQHASLQGALQVAAGIEIKRAGRFLVVMDTLVTLAPLLGLLGTITGLMKSFGSLGNEELAVQAVTGGISEALIATACGLGIAIFALIPFNFFTSRVSNLEFELQTAATNLEVMLEANAKAKGEAEMTTTTPRP